MTKRVLLAFSGGIDSCASAEQLRDEGYEVELLTIDMLGSAELVANARSRAAQLGLPLHIVDEQELFEQTVIKDFITEYLAGHTPAPCTLCNNCIKWYLLAREADRLGIVNIATGHYFKVSRHDGLCYVSRAADPRKDQSYYLWGVREDILRRVVTPMGERIKAEVKAQSDQKVESMGICFLRGKHYTEFLSQRCGEPQSGDVIESTSGEIVAQHNGIARYTIGQKRGEGIPSGLRVVGIDGVRNSVIVGENEQLYTQRIEIERCYFINPEEAFSSQEITVLVRGLGRNPDGYAHLIATANGAVVHLHSGRAWAVAAGQPVVLYIGDRVIGGGYAIIRHDISSRI